MNTLSPQTKQPNVWVLSSERGGAGDLNNGLAVANAISSRVTIVKAGQSFEGLAAPDIVINSMPGDLHRAIKEPYPRAFTVKLNIPDAEILPTVQTADMNILFRHQEKLLKSNPANSFVYDTIPTRINAEALEKGKQEWGDQFSLFQKHEPVYFIILGERADKDQAKSLEDAKNLAQTMNYVIGKSGGSVAVTTGPKTQNSQAIMRTFTDVLGKDTPFYFYDYNRNKDAGKNPYAGLLAISDRIVITNDSMSMASDAIAGGKQVYYFERQASTTSNEAGKEGTPKIPQDKYISVLYEKEMVKPLLDAAIHTDIKLKQPVNSAGRIAQDIRTLWNAKQIASSLDIAQISPMPLFMQARSFQNIVIAR